MIYVNQIYKLLRPPPERVAEVAGRAAGELLEDAREVALVREARAEGDVGRRGVRAAQPPAGVPAPQPVHVLADGPAPESPEDFGEVNRVRADLRGDAVDGQVPAELGWVAVSRERTAAATSFRLKASVFRSYHASMAFRTTLDLSRAIGLPPFAFTLPLLCTLS